MACVGTLRLLGTCEQVVFLRSGETCRFLDVNHVADFEQSFVTGLHCGLLAHGGSTSLIVHVLLIGFLWDFAFSI